MKTLTRKEKISVNTSQSPSSIRYCISLKLLFVLGVILLGAYRVKHSILFYLYLSRDKDKIIQLKKKKVLVETYKFYKNPNSDSF